MKQKGIKFAKTRIGLGRVTALLSSTTLLDNLFRIFLNRKEVSIPKSRTEFRTNVCSPTLAQ